MVVAMWTRKPITLDWQDEALIRRGWALVGLLLAQVAAMLDQRVAAHRLLRIGEAMARRLLLLSALAMPIYAAQSRRAMDAATKAKLKAQRKADTAETPPRFHLAEPLLLRSALAPSGPSYVSRDRAPRIRTLGDDPFHVTRNLLYPPESKDENPAPADDFRAIQRRLAALRHVTDAPHKAVRRMARWLSSQAGKPHGRSSHLRPGRAPGQVRDRRRRGVFQACLGDMDFAILRVRQPGSRLTTGPPDGASFQDIINRARTMRRRLWLA